MCVCVCVFFFLIGMSGTKQCWPELRSCMLPHPGRFLIPTAPHQHLTTLVMSAPNKFAALPRYKTVNLVVLLKVRQEYYPDDFEIVHYRYVSHLVFVESLL
jgi:hypothetical protein